MSPQGISTVARQEFRLRIRAGRWRWLLAVWFLLMLAFTALLRAGLSGFTREELTDRGVVIYGGLMLFVLGLALLVVPALAAQSVNGDRERGTLATLQVTRLTAADIALGKFAAAWGTSLVFLGLTLPLVVYAISQGGVPVGRMLVVTLVLSLLLGTVCAISLALSSLLSRTTTSGVLAYLSVFALTIGTLITFGLVTAVTTEKYTETFTPTCPDTPETAPEPARLGAPEDERPAPEPAPLPPEGGGPEGDGFVMPCSEEPQTYQTSRVRTDRTWWLLAPNPFVILADSAPRLAPLTREQIAERQAEQERGVFRQDARDLDPLGGIADAVRGLRNAPDAVPSASAQPGVAPPDETREERKPVWPYGLAFDVALAAGALLLTTRRLRTPTRTLATGQRVA